MQLISDLCVVSAGNVSICQDTYFEHISVYMFVHTYMHIHIYSFTVLFDTYQFFKMGGGLVFILNTHTFLKSIVKEQVHLFKNYVVYN